MSQTVLECINLTKVFNLADKQLKVIDDITLAIKSGEFVSIMGPSGSGKSTLMYLLSGMEHKTSGTINILGKDLSKMTKKEISILRSTDISFVFQAYNLIPTFNVYENVISPLLLAKKKINDKMVDETLKKVGLLKYKHNSVPNLSGGEQQRVAIARAIISEPKILFADEATGNLDSKNGKEVMELFRQINDGGTTIIQVTHSQECAEFGSRIVRLLDGKIVFDGK